MRIVYAPRALRDLYEIESYLAARSPAGRRSVLGAIKASISSS
jgi:plasmid stabilization system protein ParE